MANYIKISYGVYEEVPTTSPKRVLLNELSDQIDMLQTQKDALVNPTNQELIDFAKLVHPYFSTKDNLNNQIDELRALKLKLQSL